MRLDNRIQDPNRQGPDGQWMLPESRLPDLCLPEPSLPESSIPEPRDRCTLDAILQCLLVVRGTVCRAVFGVGAKHSQP